MDDHVLEFIFLMSVCNLLSVIAKYMSLDNSNVIYTLNFNQSDWSYNIIIIQFDSFDEHLLKLELLDDNTAMTIDEGEEQMELSYYTRR